MERFRYVLRLLLPRIIRQPVAIQVYRTIAWGRRIKHRLAVNENRAQSIAIMGRGYSHWIDFFMRLCRRPLRLFRDARVLFHCAIRRSAANTWHQAASYRHLLGTDPNKYSLTFCVKRAALSFYLALPDIYYRFCFRRFGKALIQGRQPIVAEGSGVTFVIGTLGPGGAERQAVLTLAGLAKRRIGPLKIVCQSLHYEWQRFFLPNLERIDVPVSVLEQFRGTVDDGYSKWPFDAIRNLPGSLIDSFDCARMLRDVRPEVLHLWMDECNIKCGLAAVALDVPRIVLGLRSFPPCNFVLHQPYMREGYRWLVKQPNVVLVNNSHAGARAYEKWLGLEKGVVHVVHNGFDFDHATIAGYLEGREAYRARYGIPKGVPVVGTVIRLSEEKRPLLWLEIAALVYQRMPEVRFLIVGDGLMREAVEKRIAQKDLVGVVSLLGHQREPLAAMAAMDIFLLTSRVEGLPNVLVEAQMLGVPVVTTNAGGAAETVNRGVTGWVLESDDVQHVAELIIRLLKDQEWRSKANVEASTFAQEAFGVERMLDETLDIYALDSVEIISN